MFIDDEESLYKQIKPSDWDPNNIEPKGESQNRIIPRSGLSYLRNKITSLKSRHETLVNMDEPSLRTGSELTNRKILNPKADSELNKIFGEISYRLIRKVDSSAVIMLASVTPASGNSFVALNLAVSLVSYGLSTSLVIECDAKGFSSYDYLIAKQEAKGLSDYLMSTAVTENEIIYPVGIPKIRLIPAGTRKISGEQYGSVKMLELVASLKDRYPDRYIIINAPAVKQSAYIPLLVELSDQVVVVVPYGKVVPRDLAFIAELIGEEKLLGFIFNNKPRVKIF